MTAKRRSPAPSAAFRKSSIVDRSAGGVEPVQTALDRPRIAAAVLAAAAALFLWQCWTAASRWSMTMDEVMHIPAGYIYWKLGDYSFNAEHPPLAKLIATIPLLFSHPRLPPLNGQAFVAAYRFCFEENQPRSILLPPRLAITLLGLLAGLAVFLWGRRLFGVSAATVAAVLFFLEPNITAHSSVVTTDVPVTLFFVATIAAFCWCVERLTWPRVAAFAAVFAAAIMTKFSAILLMPILATLAALAAALKAEIPQRLWRFGSAASELPPVLRTLRSRLLALLGVLIVAGAVTYATIWAVYGFSFGANDVGDNRHTGSAAEIIESLRARGVGVSRQPYTFCDRHRLLPHAYIVGLLDVARHNIEGHHAFLLGERSIKGWPQYFLVTFLVKTPLPLLLLLVLGLGLLRTRVLSSLQVAFLIVPVVFYFAVAAVSHLSIGHRHLLPTIPFVVLIAAATVPAVERLSPPWRRRSRLLVAALVLWCGYEAVRYRPHFLSYFNQLAGGPENGYTILADSNVDWGQDLYLLKQWAAESRPENLRVSYFGPAWPDADEGIACSYVTPPRIVARPFDKVTLRDGDLLAISATYLDGLYLRPVGAFDFLRQYRPLARLGYSIFIYRISDEYLVAR